MNYKEYLHLFSGAAFVFVIRVIGAGAVFGTQILLARWMGATEVGIYVYAFSLCNLLAIVASLGLPSSAIRFIGKGLAEKNHGPIVGIARIGMKIVLFSGICFAIIGEVITYQTNGIISPDYIKALTFAMAGVPAMCLINWQSNIAQCLNWFSAAFIPTNITRPLILIITIVIAQQLGQKFNAADVMLWHLIIMLFIWLCSAVYMRSRIKERFLNVKPTYQVGLWLKTGFPQLFVMLFSNFFLDINIVVVGLYLNPDHLAIFNASFRIAVLIAFGTQSVDAILIPRFSQLYAAKDNDKLQRLIMLTTQLKFWASLCGFIIFIWLGRDILAYFGKDFVQGYNALVLLTLAQVIRAAVGPLAQILSLTGHHAYCLGVSILSAVIMLVLNYFLIAQFGLLGAALTVVFIIIVESILLSIACLKRLDINASVFSIFEIFKLELASSSADAIEITIFQGDVPKNTLGTSMASAGIVEGRRDIAAENIITLTLDLDAKGILHVSAQEKTTGVEKSFTIKNAMEHVQHNTLTTTKHRIDELFNQNIPAETALSAAPEEPLEECQFIIRDQALFKKVSGEDKENMADLIRGIYSAIEEADDVKIQSAIAKLIDIGILNQT